MVDKIIEDIKIADLIYKYLRGHAVDTDEEALFQKWLESPKNRKFLNRIETTDLLYNDLYENVKFEKKWEYSCIKEQIIRQRTFRIGKYAAAIAVFLIITAAPFFLSKYFLFSASQENVVSTYKVNNSKATLETGSGELLYIGDSIKSICSDESVKLKSIAENQTVEVEDENLNYQTLTTSERRSLSVTLSDGTVVFLNAKTSLKYPKYFKGKERIVSLKGEAFFDVAKSSSPFIIKSENAKLEVLGTKFNVKAIGNGENITTLVRGKIKIMMNNNDSLILEPGEQIYVNQLGDFTIKEVDTHYYTAWKNNLFAFKQVELKDIISSIADWYGLTCLFENEDIKKTRYTSMIYRYDDVDNVLNVLNSLDEFHCSIKDGRYIIVSDVK